MLIQNSTTHLELCILILHARRSQSQRLFDTLPFFDHFGRLEPQIADRGPSEWHAEKRINVFVDCPFDPAFQNAAFRLNFDHRRMPIAVAKRNAQPTRDQDTCGGSNASNVLQDLYFIGSDNSLNYLNESSIIEKEVEYESGQFARQKV
uniref:Uncharacterized protein n=1 Tax=Romanomermis culicivorax TaxID=13658 RepID=A0A915LB84_ROMCU